MTSRRFWIALAAIACVLATILVARSQLSGKPARAGKPRSQSAAAKLAPRVERNVDLDDDAAGTVRLEGQVIDADARPVGGAVVTIDARPARTATTEADGSFVFEGLTGRTYDLVATAGERVAGPVSVQLGDRTEPVILRLGAGATLEVGVVLARDQSPVAGASVHVRGLVDREAAADRAGAAAFRGVPSGWYLVVAFAPGLAPATTFANVSTGTATVRLELVAGAAVAGRVVDPDGRAVAGAKVRYEGVSDWLQNSSDAIITDADGRFRVAALPAGSFRFTAKADEHAPGASDALVLDGKTPREDVTIRLQPGATITGVVLDDKRVPVPWARVRAREDESGLAMQRTRQATADAQGKFRIAGLPRSGIQLAALGEQASSATARVDLAARHDASVELVLAIDGVIAGHVVDSTGEPVDGAQVWADAPDATLRGESVALTDGSGAFALRGLPTGELTLRTNPPGAPADLEMLLLRREVKAAVGARDVRIVLPADGGISGKVVFEDGRPATSFIVSLGGASHTVASKDGSFTLRDLPPREYHVTIRGAIFADKALAPLAVAPGKIVDAGTITVHTGRSISGRVVDASGSPIAGATVVAGSIVWGTGSKASAPEGMSGPPGASSVKRATTNARGEFTFVGVGRGERHVVAEHDAHGRSVPVTVQTAERSVTDLQLALVPFGALEGRVTIRGAAASRIVVNAQSKTVPAAMYSVVTGADGSYRFDRLAPDTYSVSAMLGADPTKGFGFHARTTTVPSGKATHLDLDVAAGDVTLVVKPTAAKPVTFAIVYSVRGTLTATTAKELEKKTLALEAGQSAFGMAIGGGPARLEKLAPGAYTVCASPYPAEVGFEVEDYMVREGDNLPVFCKQVQVTPKPVEQSLVIPVEIPAFVPAPEER